MKITIDIPDTTVSNYIFYEMKMVENDLKPCPFCGSKAKMYRYYHHAFSNRVQTIVECTKCRCNSGDWGRVDEAIKAWNRRAKE